MSKLAREEEIGVFGFALLALFVLQIAGMMIGVWFWMALGILAWMAWSREVVPFGALEILHGLNGAQPGEATRTPSARINETLRQSWPQSWTLWMLVVATLVALGTFPAMWWHIIPKGAAMLAFLFYVFCLLLARRSYRFPLPFPDIWDASVAAYGTNQEMRYYTRLLTAPVDVLLVAFVLAAIFATECASLPAVWIVFLALMSYCGILALLVAFPLLPFANITMDWKYPPYQMYLRQRFGNMAAMRAAIEKSKMQDR
ncbi:hypothetical protein JKG47_01775 [Acidithiobacillus sp. MC6.1]|nr:hypothetical protein [Acidithiobacillus sp. MC6.1]